jgi:predicted nucleotidyltransferase
MLIQECSLWKVAEIFFIEPTKIHFIREISRKIKLAPTSIRKHIQTLIKKGLIIKVKSAPFDGYVALRENPDFIFEKRIANLISIKSSGLIEYLNEKYPKNIVLFGSFNKGEDIETSDIDIFIRLRSFEINLNSFEKFLNRKIHLLFEEQVDKSLLESINQGILLAGER